MQIRLGAECFGKHRKGRSSIYLSLKPKGWLQHGKFGIDVGTLKAIKALKAFTVNRWHPTVFDEKHKPTLPAVPFGNSQPRGELPEARYLLQAKHRALTPAELMTFNRILLMGVIDMRSHDGRYIFATMLGLRGAGYTSIGQLLHHSPGSAMPAKYDLSLLMLADEAAERFNAQCEAGLAGQVADG